MASSSDRIVPWPQNPSYWMYKGKGVLLLGGSVEDNLFQIDGVRTHLDTLAAVGGNYVRCTMSSRDKGDVWPFERSGPGGKYDLREPGGEYWRRFEQFCDLTLERDIIMQIEVWDRFDFAREPWLDNPFNPANNVNYTAQQSGLAERIDTHPGKRESAFFRTVPALENNATVLAFQHAFLDKLLSISLKYPNVLYCMDNETNEDAAWPEYWATYIRDKARQAGVEVQLTEMWDAHDLGDQMHERTWKRPELYSFCDISQNCHQSGLAHWHNMQAFRQRVLDSGKPKPINNVKIYGANTGWFGTNRDAQERFWRNIFGGLASTRFHRPPSGLGLSPLAQAHIRSARMLANAIDVFSCQPRMDLLDGRNANMVYCMAASPAQYALFWTDGGHIRLKVQSAAQHEITWLDIVSGRWQRPERLIPQGSMLEIQTPSDGYWAARICAQE